MDIFESIKSTIDTSQSIVLIPHTNADGDATGSCFALAMFLQKLGKSVDVVFEEFPRLSSVVYHDFIVYEGKKRDYDLSVAVDCADKGRMGNRAELFCGKTICIDHHKTNGNIADINYVESQSSSTGELVFELISHINPSLLDKATAEPIYMAISADTGCFKYSNVTAETFEIASALMRVVPRGFSELNKVLFDTSSMRKLRMEAYSVEHTELLYDGRAAFTAVTLEVKKSLEADHDDCDNIINIVRTIEGVEIALVAKEKEPGYFKVSVRSEDGFDAAAFCSRFGGGGHRKAAGCSLRGSVGEVRDALVKALGEALA